MRNFLRRTGMEELFPEEYAFGVHTRNGDDRSKAEALRDFLQGRKYDSIVAVGDSPHDLIGDVNFLYAHPGRAFRECAADYRIRDLREIKKEI